MYLYSFFKFSVSSVAITIFRTFRLSGNAHRWIKVPRCFFHYLIYNFIIVQSLGLPFKIQEKAMSHNRQNRFGNIVKTDMVSFVQHGANLTR